MASGCLKRPLQKQYSDAKEIALSFSGCGFLGTYHFGVLKCLNRNGKPLMKRVRRCAGASAGSLVAALCVLAPNKAEDGLNDMYSLAEEINNLRFGAITPGFLLNERLTRIVEANMPTDISYAQEKLFVSLTRQKDSQNVLMSRYRSRDHLINCLAASCYIPMYSMGFDIRAPRPLIDNEIYIDGGYTNNLPVFTDLLTLTVSPFSGEACIAPQDYNPLKPYFDWRMKIGNQEMNVNMQNIVRGAHALFPPAHPILRNYYEMGFRDAMKFLIESGLIERQNGTAV